MAKQENLAKAFNAIRNEISGSNIVCESGGLHELVQPGIFLFVKKKNEFVKNQDLLKYAPIIVSNHNGAFDFSENCIDIKNNRVTLNMKLTDKL